MPAPAHSRRRGVPVGRLLLPVVAVAAAVVGSVAAAEGLALPAVFGDHMVLQRDKPVPVWGTAPAGAEVTVAFAGQEKRAAAGADGRWLVRLDPLPATATPARLTVTSRDESRTIEDVLVGEVWLGSGQSNMAMTVNRSRDFDAERKRADLPLVRMFRESSGGAPAPQFRGAGGWQVCTPETVGGFSATLYFFGRELHAALGVPVGLVNSSVGGTPIESWIDREAQARVPEFAPLFAARELAAAKADRTALAARHEENLAKWREAAAEARRARKPVPRRPKDPLAQLDRDLLGSLYDGKIAPLVPFAIRGVVWYQGEANAKPGAGPLYRLQLPLLVTDWRAKWGEELPFGWVQLPNIDRPGEDWMLVREAMLRSLVLPRTGMAITIDIGEAKDIHPRNKADVGRRLAAWALTDVYGRSVPARSGPLPAGSTPRGGEIVCRFTDAEGLRDRDGAELEGFAVAGGDRAWRPARARIEGSTVVVSADGVPQPVAVRYGWAANPKCDLVNGAGLPASPFRSDDWPVESTAPPR